MVALIVGSANILVEVVLTTGPDGNWGKETIQDGDYTVNRSISSAYKTVLDCYASFASSTPLGTPLGSILHPNCDTGSNNSIGGLKEEVLKQVKGARKA